mmetsp:Transcript_23156/g.41850  ORF Transcript_23156/g.41850 Transcript_23156/m.41850 type:complete len:180 (+) Transcript_23156:27-566(+)
MGEPEATPAAEKTSTGKGKVALASQGKKRRLEDVHVTWNEEILAEHDKERGTRQKIDEPPTPFNFSPLDLSEDEVEGDGKASHSAVDSALLHARLLELSETKEAPEESESQRQVPAPSSPAPSVAVSTVSWADATGSEKKSSAAFKAKRAAHYDEFKVMQAKRKKAAATRQAESSGDES